MKLKLRIKTKLVGAGLFVCLLLFGILGITVYYFSSLNSGFQEIITISGSGVKKSESADQKLSQTNTAINELTARMDAISTEIGKTNMFVQITARKIKGLSGDLNDITESIEETLEELQDEDARDSLEMVADDIGDLQESMKREALIGIDKAVTELKRFVADIAAISDETRLLTGEVSASKALSQDVKKINHDIQTLSLQFNKAISNNSNTLSITIFIVAVFIPIAGFLFSRSITVPLARAVNFAQKVAQRDLTHQIDIDQQDEIGDLIRSLNTMSKNLRTMFTEIASGTNTLNTSCNELSTVSEQIKINSEKTAENSNNVAGATEDMSANMQSVASATELTTANITRIVSATSEMGHTINEIAENTSKARITTSRAVQTAGDVSEKVDKLGSSVSEISKVTEAIADISEQTNLLALNATIEAARAGEAGKGFGVVAGEIKALAQQTAEATQEINGKVSEVQETTSMSIDSIKSIVDEINNINDIVTVVAAAIEEQSVTTKEISENVSQAADSVQEVNMNVSQTSAAASEISQDIVLVSQSADEMKTGSLDVNQSAMRLSDLAGKLDEMVRQSKL